MLKESERLRHDLSHFPDELTVAPNEQQRIRAKCVHPFGTFVRFREEDIEQSIPERFEQQARKYPDRVAVKTQNDALTFDELNQRANRVAQAILSQRGQGQECIALLLGQGAPLIFTNVSILKAGKTVVPLDPSYLYGRASYMLENSQACLIVTNNRYVALARELATNGIQLLNIDEIDASLSSENLGLRISSETPAYIMYTSGSTGQPKGVVQSHQNVLHWVMHYTNAVHICPYDKLALLYSCGFVDSARNIFSALLNGAFLFPFDVRAEGLINLTTWLIREEVTIYNSVATLFRHFVNILTGLEEFAKLRVIYLTGEPVYQKDVELYKKYFSPDCILINGIGAAETPNFGRYFMDKAARITGGIVPVGHSSDDTEVLLLNDAGAEVGIDQVGEIAVKSRYLSLGYWRKPDLTHATFLPAPEGGDKRIYRTGDLGRMLSDGCLIQMGRKDFQVKVRGFRIETSEIEATLLKLDSVKEAVVITHGNQFDDKRLVAYIVPATQPPTTVSELRRGLAMQLPDYMIPSTFVMLEALPLNANGKVDRRALLAPDQARPELIGTFIAPRDALEVQLTKVWEKVLGIQPIGVRNNFFELGGHSLLAARLFAEIEKTFGKNLQLASLFQAPTVERLANILRQEAGSKPLSSLVAIQPGGSKPPFFCVPGMLGNVFTDLGDLARSLGPRQPFYGLQDSIRNPAQIEALAAHYVDEIRIVQPEGPYLLGGVCSGGVVAFEMAQQLQAKGQRVALLALVDTPYLRLPGLCSYFEFVSFIFRRTVRRFSHHSRSFAQHSSAERTAYIRLKMKLIANEWALRCYAPQLYPGQIQIFITDESLRSLPNRFLKWRELATGGAEIHVIPGRHDTIVGANTQVEAAQMSLLAERLRAHIDDLLTNGNSICM